MGRPRFALWLGAVFCGVLISTPAFAGGMFGLFSHRSNAECDQCPADGAACQQPCQTCQNCPPKKKKTCCLCPPEPPRAPIGTALAAQPQGVLANNNTDNNKAQQDERFDRIERDLTRLTLIVQKLAEQNPTPAVPAAAPAGAAKASVDSIPPGPIPNSVRAPRFSAVQQVSAPNSNTAIGR